MLGSLIKSYVQANKTIVFAGIGNVLRHDDGVGVYLAQKIHPCPFIHVLSVEVGIENHIGKINSLEPDLLILMDCVFFYRRPGYHKLIPVDKLMDFTTNTHNIALGRLSEFFTAQIFVLGIQPTSVSFGEGLSDPVARKADLLAQQINSSFTCK